MQKIIMRNAQAAQAEDALEEALFWAFCRDSDREAWLDAVLPPFGVTPRQMLVGGADWAVLEALRRMPNPE